MPVCQKVKDENGFFRSHPFCLLQPDILAASSKTFLLSAAEIKRIGRETIVSTSRGKTAIFNRQRSNIFGAVV